VADRCRCCQLFCSSAQLQQPGFLKVETPKAFNAAHQETLKADATVVNLFAWSPYYYLFGLAYARMADDALLVDTLQAVRLSCSAQ